MIVSRARRLGADKAISDLEPGDMVRQIGSRGVGLVESVSDGHALVAWDAGRRDILPLAAVRRVRAAGAEFDRRPGP